MDGIKATLCMRTLNRPNTLHVLNTNLARTGIDRSEFELLVWDNGSTDRRAITTIKQYEPDQHRLYPKNIGNAQAFNQQLLVARGEYIIDMGNDIELPSSWLANWITTYNALKQEIKVGALGYHWGYRKWNKPVTINGVLACPTENPFGSMIFHRDLLEDVGYMCEDYGPYGLWDGDFHFRCIQAGCKHFYMPNRMSKHVGEDHGTNSDYRQLKNNSLKKHTPVLHANLELYKYDQYHISAPKPL